MALAWSDWDRSRYRLLLWICFQMVYSQWWVVPVSHTKTLDYDFCPGEVEFLDVWHEAYAAIMRYSRNADGFWVSIVTNIKTPASLMRPQFRPVSIHSGDAVFNTVDSLSAFWPGLQVLAGDIENAIKSHLICVQYSNSITLRRTDILP